MNKSTTPACSVDGCETPIGSHGARGYCPKHYKRWKATGDATRTRYVRRHATDEERLLHYLESREPGTCWEWQGTRDGDGYGHVSGANSPRIASRVAYETWVGPIPGGMVICHTCDNPPCCNPEHLFPGTHRVNTLDMLAKQRGSHGEKHHWHRLTDEQVHAIRYMADQGMQQRPIARLIGCSQAQVSNIVRRAQRQHDTNWQPKPALVEWVARNARGKQTAASTRATVGAHNQGE